MIFNISTDIVSAKVNLPRLQTEIIDNFGQTPLLLRIDGNFLNIEFSSSLSAEDQATITAIVAAHSGEPYPEPPSISQVKVVEEVASAPFASKQLSNGQKLFKRVHGVSKTIAANSTDTIQLIVPYSQAKINGLEIVGARHGDTANFNVYDTADGTISSIPNYKLNQFGFNVNLAKDFYKEKSQYDADIIQNMVLELEITNNNDTEVLIGANFILHQLI